MILVARHLARYFRGAFVATAAASALVLTAVVALVVSACRTPLPAVFSGPPPVSVEIRDRDGKLLRELRTAKGALASVARLSDLSPHVVPALLAAEDARFFEHSGVDPLAILRAAGQLLWERRIVSGASTLTQQLARNVASRPRTLLGKWREMALALRIEASMDKTRILEEYLGRIEFGPNLVGIDAASRWYFDKPASELDLSEAAALVSMPRSPTLYDPSRSTARVVRRRNRVLERLRAHHLASGSAIDRALQTELRVSSRYAEGGALHFAQALVEGKLPNGLSPGAPLRRIDTTLDGGLQREVEALVRRAASDLSASGGSALSVLVVDNASGEVLAYVGSPDYHAVAALGANDGVLALRQPGSALKPFVYAAAMDGLGMTAATLLPDVPVTLSSVTGPYSPHNYDGQMHGPVRLRTALGSSLNVPAVVVAEELGPARVLDHLRRFGFTSLGEAATHYGAALALGDGEVRLLELAAAYAALARGGSLVPLSFVRTATRVDGATAAAAAMRAVRVVDPGTAAVITDILADPDARAPSFGRGGVLELPFEAAVKTGTSKGYRDNWAVGFTREVTVAVWAGNFDGAPMVGSTGVTGAGPLFHDVLVAAMRGREPAPLVQHGDLVDTEVCALSGELPTEACPHRRHEWFAPERVPTAPCEYHERVAIDPQNGLRAGSGCPGAVARTFERYPPRYAAWAAAAHRPAAPTLGSPRCPPGPERARPESGAAAVRFPLDGARFSLDPGGPRRQEIVLSARPSPGARSVRFIMDGHAIGSAGAPFELPWDLVPGRHTLEVRSAGTEAALPVTFEVADVR